MALPIHKREALGVLAGNADGCTVSFMLAHGFGIGTIDDLVRDKLATSERRTVRRGQRLIAVTWLTITDAGRRGLAV